MANGNNSMGPWRGSFLLIYLMSCTILLLYLIYGLWGALPQTSPSSAPSPDDASAPVEENALPELIAIDPTEVTIGASRAAARVLGRHFQETSTVQLDGTDRESEFISPIEMVVRLSDSDLADPGPIVVKVANGEDPKDLSNSKTLFVRAHGDKAGVWNFFSKTLKIPPELRQLLLILFTGALGASIAGLNSLVNFSGSQCLFVRWQMFYWVRPAIGAGIAFTFYLVVGAGFLPGAGEEPGLPYGILAIAVLAGMFSDPALLKLREIFIRILNPKDDRPDKMPDANILDIETNNLPDASVTTMYDQKLQARGGQPPYQWTVTPTLPAGLSLDTSTGRLSGTATAVHPKALYTFEVMDADGDKKNKRLYLEVQ